MPSILYVLSMLACPVGMGLILWMTMRSGGNQQAHPDKHAEAGVATRSTRPGSRSQPFSLLKMILDCIRMCLNWKVVGVLVLAALVIALLAPQWLREAIPLLLLLVCPLSMLVMLFLMRPHTRQSHGMEQPATHGQKSEEPAASRILRE